MNIRRKLGTLMLLSLASCAQTIASAQRADTHHNSSAPHNRIVGVWDAQVKVFDCSTGTLLFSYPGLHKYERGGTAQVVPATNPALLSAHAGIWRHVRGNNYQLAFKVFRFNAAGDNIGWQIVRFDVVISEDGTQEAGSGRAEIFDANGNKLGMSCPTFAGTRFQ